MNPLPFIVAAYAVILGGMGAYLLLLWRRLARARRELDEVTGAGANPQRDDA